jgi:putative transposase
MKPSYFKKGTQIFHLNMHFEVSGYFKELDWIRLQKVIAHEARIFDIDVQALLMMDSHFHLLIESRAKKENFFSAGVNNKMNGLRNLNSHCEPIDSVSQYLNTYKYIFNNPVQAGLCLRVEDYPFSSIRSLLGMSTGYVLVSDQLRLIQNPVRVLNWMNTEVQFKLSTMTEQTYIF